MRYGHPAESPATQDQPDRAGATITTPKAGTTGMATGRTMGTGPAAAEAGAGLSMQRRPSRGAAEHPQRASPGGATSRCRPSPGAERRVPGALSPGTIYPTIAQLEDEGLVSVIADSGRKLVTLTDAGREFLTANEASLGDPFSTVQAGPDSDLRGALEQLHAAARAVAQGRNDRAGHRCSGRSSTGTAGSCTLMLASTAPRRRPGRKPGRSARPAANHDRHHRRHTARAAARRRCGPRSARGISL